MAQTASAAFSHPVRLGNINISAKRQSLYLPTVLRKAAFYRPLILSCHSFRNVFYVYSDVYIFTVIYKLYPV